MKPRKERATKQLRIYPSSYEKLRRISFTKRISLARAITELLSSYEGRRAGAKQKV